jgi:hypothetical protein
MHFAFCILQCIIDTSFLRDDPRRHTNRHPRTDRHYRFPPTTASDGCCFPLLCSPCVRSCPGTTPDFLFFAFIIGQQRVRAYGWLREPTPTSNDGLRYERAAARLGSSSFHFECRGHPSSWSKDSAGKPCVGLVRFCVWVWKDFVSLFCCIRIFVCFLLVAVSIFD